MPVPDITNQHGLYSPDQLAAAVQVAGGLWVHLSDLAYELAGIGPRFARVIEGKIDGQPVSWAYLEDGKDIYGLITADMEPHVLGTPREVLGDDGIYPWLDDQIVRWGRNLTRQQKILMTAYAREIGLQIGDRVAARRPANLDRKPALLTRSYLGNYDAFTAAVEDAFANDLRRHHALDDAKANQLGWIAAGGDIERKVP